MSNIKICVPLDNILSQDTNLHMVNSEKIMDMSIITTMYDYEHNTHDNTIDLAKHIPYLMDMTFLIYKIRRILYKLYFDFSIILFLKMILNWRRFNQF